jgi:hypothetical protein
MWNRSCWFHIFKLFMQVGIPCWKVKRLMFPGFLFCEVRSAASNSACYGYPELWILRYPPHRYHTVPSPGFEPTTLWLRVLTSLPFGHDASFFLSPDWFMALNVAGINLSILLLYKVELADCYALQLLNYSSKERSRKMARARPKASDRSHKMTSHAK